MSKEDTEDSKKIFDLTSLGFSEFFFKNLGSNARLPFWVKGLIFFTVIFSIGIGATYIANTFFPWSSTGAETAYSTDYSFIISCAIAGGTLSYLLVVLDSLNCAFAKMNNRLDFNSNPKDNEAFNDFSNWVRQGMPFGKKFFEKPAFWYHLETVGGAILAGWVGVYWVTNPLTNFWGKPEFPISCIYFIAFCAILGYVIGAVVFVTVGSIKTIRKYCRDFVSSKKILALNPDNVGGLRPIGQFALSLDIAFALPSFVIFSYLAQGVSMTHPLVLVLLSLYTIMLVVVFFIPLSSAHNAMKEAKETAFDQVNEIFKEVNSQISPENKKFDFNRIKTLQEVDYLYNKVSKMAVWPLNLNIVLKFVATSSFPIIGSLVITIVANVLGIGYPIT